MTKLFFPQDGEVPVSKKRRGRKRKIDKLLEAAAAAEAMAQAQVRASMAQDQAMRQAHATHVVQAAQAAREAREAVIREAAAKRLRLSPPSNDPGTTMWDVSTACCRKKPIDLMKHVANISMAGWSKHMYNKHQVKCKEIF